MIVRPYDPADAAQWDALVTHSLTGTLLQTRRFLGYHEDRFEDMSVVVEDPNLAHVLPMARVGPVTVNSHPGATHGGLVSRGPLAMAEALAVFNAVRDHLLARGIENVRYTPIPHVFHRVDSEADSVALSMLGAQLVRRAPNAVLDLDRMGLRRRKNRARARRAGCESALVSDVAETYGLIERTLARRHDAAPVHSLVELELLKRLFPDDVIVIGTRIDHVLVATIVVFRIGRAMHVQYMASSELGFEVQGLDHSVEFLCDSVMGGSGQVSFGISTERDGASLNTGLMRFKETFGAVVQPIDQYVWDLRPRS